MSTFPSACLLACVVLMAACASTNTSPSGEEAEYRRLALERFGDTTAVAYVPNTEGGTYMLVLQEDKAAETPSLPVTRFFVYDRAGAQVVYEERGIQGSVAWHDAHHLRVRVIPGIVPANPDRQPAATVYLVDVRTGNRRPEAPLPLPSGQ